MLHVLIVTFLSILYLQRVYIGSHKILYAKVRQLLVYLHCISSTATASTAGVATAAIDADDDISLDECDLDQISQLIRRVSKRSAFSDSVDSRISSINTSRNTEVALNDSSRCSVILDNNVLAVGSPFYDLSVNETL